MKKSFRKTSAVFLCAVLAISTVVPVVCKAAGNGKQTAANAELSYQAPFSDEDGKKSISQIVSLSADIAVSKDSGISKDETVYVLANADGSVQKIIVSDWIKNASDSQTITDKTDLSNVENTKGEQSYTMDGDNSYVWEAAGNDVYYQGETDKELPVRLTVTYKLDGEPISPSELAGKSGRVTIRFDYENCQYEEVEIDGKKEKIYVPFAMLTGVILDNDICRNVEVSNGKLVNDGSRTIIAGIAFPGMEKNLGITKEDFDIPDYVEISCDAENFQLGTTVTLATNEIFNEVDSDKLDSADDLKTSMGELTDGMAQLLDGSSQLYDGLEVLLEKSDELVNGVNQLTDGAKALKTGAGDLNTGASQLQSGAKQLSEGLDTLVQNNDDLNGGAKQVFETLLSTANEQLKNAGLEVPTLTISNYAEVLNNVIASLDENAVYEKALAAVESEVENKRSYIEEQVTAAVKEQVTAQVAAAVKEQVAAQVTQAVRDTVRAQVLQSTLQMDAADYDAAVASGAIDEATQAAVGSAIDQQMQSQQVQETIQAKIDEQMAAQQIIDTIAKKTDEQMQSDEMKQTIASNVDAQVQKAISDAMASPEVQAQLAAAAEGAKSVISLKTSLDSYNSFYLGLATYTSGVAEAASGAKTLKAGTEDLKAGTEALYGGASELYSGILTLKNGTPALKDGVAKLRDGAMQLSDGLKELNEKGIQKLADAVNGDMDSLVVRFRAMLDVSKNYKTFAGADGSMDGQVKFIYRTDSIE